MDWCFLERQCCGDRALERELLDLFAASNAPLVAALPLMGLPQQDEAAHRLKGSSQGIGAWALARAACAVENASPDQRGPALAQLAAAFAATRQAILRRLAAA